MLTPTKIARPVPPKYLTLDPNQPISTYRNFKSLQVNAVLQSDYVRDLESTIDYYEESIDVLDAQKNTTAE